MWGAEVALGKFVGFDLLKVSDLLLIYESPKWILRYAQYDGVVDCHDSALPNLAMTKRLWIRSRFALA